MAIQGSSKLAPVDVDADDLASMTDTVPSIAATVNSTAAPPAASTASQGLSKLAPVDVDANDLTSMADTVYATSEPSHTSSDSSISGNPPDNYETTLELHQIYHSGATSAAPLDDMEMELPEEDPDPVTDDADMPDSSNLPLSSVGDPQQTLGDGPPTAPPQGIYFPRPCFGRLGQVGVTHHSWNHKTCHLWYQQLYSPQQLT